MSQFYDQASLVMVPSGYKNGKLYSQKPLSTSGELSFSRASNATRVNSSGLVEKVRTNLVRYSEDFSNAAWSKSAGTTLTHSQSDPNSGTTATRVVMTGGANNYLYQSITTNSGTYTISIYIKGTSGAGSICLSTGTSASRIGNTINYTTNWARYSIVVTEAVNISGFQLDNYSDSLGQIASDFIIAFAQNEVSDIATDYIATTSAAVSVGPVSGLPRLDYSGGASCCSLLLEPQRTNLALWSEQMDNASWIKLNGAVTANAAVSPDGYTNADKFVPNTTSGVHALRSNLFNQSATAAHSWFVKADGYSKVAVRESELVGNYASFNLVTGTLISTSQTGSIVNYGNGWYRLTLVDTTTGVNAQTSIVVLPDSYTTGDPIINWSGDGTKGVLAYGASVELGAYATSYIPTLSSAVTRVADAASKTGISSLIGQTEGTLFVQGEAVTIDAQANSPIYLTISDGTQNNISYIQQLSDRTIRTDFFSGAVRQARITSTTAYPIGTTLKMALAYASGDFAFYINGVLIGTATGTSIPAMSQINVGAYVLANYTGAAISQTLLFKTRLSNADLATLTTL